MAKKEKSHTHTDVDRASGVHRKSVYKVVGGREVLRLRFKNRRQRSHTDTERDTHTQSVPCCGHGANGEENRKKREMATNGK